MPGRAHNSTSQSTNTLTRCDNCRCGGYNADSAIVGTATLGNELAALEAIFPANAPAGLRYPVEVMAMLDI